MALARLPVCAASWQAVEQPSQRGETVTTLGRPRLDWTVILRRRLARIVVGQPEGSDTDMFEIICRDCGDHPGLDYRQASPELQRIRGPYALMAGGRAYGKQVDRHRVNDQAAGSRKALPATGLRPLPGRPDHRLRYEVQRLAVKDTTASRRDGVAGRRPR
jgi:hypothetical protein